MQKRGWVLSMRQVDYYALLGVSRHSTDEEIKLNYRKLAKIYHPDANVDDEQAEEKFKQLNTAYATLTDKEKRKKYDRQVAIYRYGYSKPKKSPAQKVADAASGTSQSSASDIVNELLGNLFGLGREAKERMLSTADEFKTRLEDMKEPKKGDNIETTLEISIEEGFLGVEKKLSLKGINGNTNNYTVSVPRGIKDGDKIRLAALGKPGKNGGKPGDLIITVKLKSHPLYNLNGANVLANLYISHAQSVIGDTVYLKVFGEQIEIKIPERTRNKDKMVIKNKGYAIENTDRGDLIVTYIIQPTENLSERERKIYEQLLKVEKQKLKEKVNKKFT